MPEPPNRQISVNLSGQVAQFTRAGFIETEMTRALGESVLGEVKARISGQTPGPARRNRGGRAVPGLARLGLSDGAGIDGRRGIDGVDMDSGSKRRYTFLSCGNRPFS